MGTPLRAGGASPPPQGLQNLAARPTAGLDADLPLHLFEGVPRFLADLAVGFADIVAPGGQETLELAALQAGQGRIVRRPGRPGVFRVARSGPRSVSA